MKLSETIKQEIYDEYNFFKNKLYAGKSLEERKELDQFFTPPELTIEMIEKMDCEDLSDKIILDPTCGSGNLLVACLIAGAAPKNLYGNDYDAKMVRLCRRRLIQVTEDKGLPRYTHWEQNIHRGNALQKYCLTEFSKTYNDNYKEEYIDDLKYAQGNYSNGRDAGWEKENYGAWLRANPPEQTTLW